MLVGFLLAVISTSAQSIENSQSGPKIITTVREAHSLTSEEAAQARPVHLRAVITCLDPSSNGTVVFGGFVHDATGSIYVVFPYTEANNKLTPGTVVDLYGVTDPGTFAPSIGKDHLRVYAIGHAPLPENPPRESLSGLETGSEDAKWVEAEGIVHSVRSYPRYVSLQLAMSGGIVGVLILREPGADYSHLVDAKVLVHANAAPKFNSTDQVMGVRLMSPNLSAIKVEEAAPQDPFQQPLSNIDDLLRWDQSAALRHRVHVRGRITMLWPGVSFCIQDATRGICAQTVQETHLSLGEIADVVGFASAQNGTPVFTDAVYQGAGMGEPVQAKPITAEQALLGKNDSELVQIEGQLIGNDRTAADTTLLLTAGNTVFTAVLPKALAGSKGNSWQIGSRLRLVGICSVQLDAKRGTTGEGVAAAKSFRILMRSSQDVVVQQLPSWWTPAHALPVLALALTGALGVLLWLVRLRRRLEQQGSLLRESEERFRHMALHDGLTGLATRVLLQDRLHFALDSAKRHHSGLALMILDIDKFKGINDRFGHPAGDEVLRVTAKRLLGTVRACDTVARFGGDEFVVLLHDLDRPEVAEKVAAKIVAALSVSIYCGGREVPVTASVGVCTYFSGEMDENMLIKNADAALYRAKELGRNRFEVFVAEAIKAPVELTVY